MACPWFLIFQRPKKVDVVRASWLGATRLRGPFSGTEAWLWEPWARSWPAHIHWVSHLAGGAQLHPGHQPTPPLPPDPKGICIASIHPMGKGGILTLGRGGWPSAQHLTQTGAWPQMASHTLTAQGRRTWHTHQAAQHAAACGNRGSDWGL